MVKVDFTCYRDFLSCPTWWRNFVTHTFENLNKDINEDIQLRSALGKFHGTIIDSMNDVDDIDHLIFENKDDFNSFKLYWTIRGE